MITYAEALSDTLSMDLEVSVEGMEISVVGGKVTLGEVVGTVPSAACTIVSDDDYPVSVFGYVVQDRESGKLDLLVDEVAVERGDRRYRFSESGPYRLLNRLFHMNVPAGATDLSEVLVTVWKIVAEKVEDN